MSFVCRDPAESRRSSPDPLGTVTKEGPTAILASAGVPVLPVTSCAYYGYLYKSVPT